MKIASQESGINLKKLLIKHKLTVFVKIKAIFYIFAGYV
jgi:hypothetical protein